MIQVNKLLVIAGPSCVGKSTLIERLQEGKLPTISRQLKIGDPSLWTFAEWDFAETHGTAHTPTLEISQLVLHYNFLRVLRRDARRRTHEEDPALHILTTSRDITFVTLWSSPDVLALRVKSRFEIGTHTFRDFRTLRRTYHELRQQGFRYRTFLYRLYGNKQKLLERYDAWFAFCLKYNSRAHWIVDNTDNLPALFPLVHFPHIIHPSS